MNPWPRHPVVYEINTWGRLDERSATPELPTGQQKPIDALASFEYKQGTAAAFIHNADGQPINQAMSEKKWRVPMTKKGFSLLSMFIIATFAAGISMGYAQTAPGDFTGEPDKSMAAGHESFVKKNMNKAAEQISKAADYVKKEADKVTQGSKAGVKTAGDELAKLGQGVKKGTVKSGDELKKVYGQVDHELAKAWHKTADEAKKTGKDSSEALKNAGTSLEGAAKWSGNKLQEGAQASVDAVKKVGKGAAKGVKAGSEEVNKWFKGIGEGIEDLGSKL
jgi:hypothetical protein